MPLRRHRTTPAGPTAQNTRDHRNRCNPHEKRLRKNSDQAAARKTDRERYRNAPLQSTPRSTERGSDNLSSHNAENQSDPPAIAVVILTLLCGGAVLADVKADVKPDPATRKLALDVYQQLIEINTADSVGSVTAASEAMAQRFRMRDSLNPISTLSAPPTRRKISWYDCAAPASASPSSSSAPRCGRSPGREDWTTDPYQFVVKDGFYYGRGTQDMKDGDAIMVATLIRLKKELYRPDTNIILAMTAGEESGLTNGVA